jgi:NAD-dependent SIR2 family protein deacetylase
MAKSRENYTKELDNVLEQIGAYQAEVVRLTGLLDQAQTIGDKNNIQGRLRACDSRLADLERSKKYLEEVKLK